MLEKAAEKAEKLNLTINFKKGNALNLEFEDDHFDSVFSMAAIEFIKDLETAFKEMKRVVKPGGVVASLDLSKPIYWGYRQIYFFYLFNIVPLVGQLITDNYEEYAWMPKSLKNFPDSKQLAGIFKQLGFSPVKTDLFAGGAVALHRGVN